jgi:hypothetical protein
MDVFGNHTDTWTMDGRYGVPRHTISNRPDRKGRRARKGRRVH